MTGEKSFIDPELSALFLHVLPVSPGISSGFSGFLPLGGLAILTPLGVTECVHYTLQWTGVPSRVYAHLTLCVPGIGSRSTATLTRTKEFQKIDE